MAPEHTALTPHRGSELAPAETPLRADPTALAEAVAGDADALLRDRAAAMFAFNPTSLGGHALGAIVIELVFGAVAPVALRVAWGTSFALLWLARAALYSASREAVPPVLGSGGGNSTSGSCGRALMG